jgi:hypothetical protein
MRKARQHVRLLTLAACGRTSGVPCLEYDPCPYFVGMASCDDWYLERNSAIEPLTRKRDFLAIREPHKAPCTQLSCLLSNPLSLHSYTKELVLSFVDLCRASFEQSGP